MRSEDGPYIQLPPEHRAHPQRLGIVNNEEIARFDLPSQTIDVVLAHLGIESFVISRQILTVATVVNQIV